MARPKPTKATTPAWWPASQPYPWTYYDDWGFRVNVMELPMDHPAREGNSEQ